MHMSKGRGIQDAHITYKGGKDHERIDTVGTDDKMEPF